MSVDSPKSKNYPTYYCSQPPHLLHRRLQTPLCRRAYPLCRCLLTPSAVLRAAYIPLPELDSPPSWPDADVDGNPQPAGATAGMPRPHPAPAFTVANAIMEKEDGLGCRCGHTFTAAAAIGEEARQGSSARG